MLQIPEIVSVDQILHGETSFGNNDHLPAMAYEQYTPDLDHDEQKRIQPYKCTSDGFTRYSVGFISQDELRVHPKTCHSEISAHREDCPALTEAARTHQSEERGLQIFTTMHLAPAESLDGVREEELEHTFDICQTPGSGSEPRSLPDSPAKSDSSKNFRCEHCSKVFTRLYNLKSHLITHDRTTPFSCDICNRAFARKSDAKRHMRTHSGEKNWICKGCQTPFARRDMLSSHHKSQKGQACLRGQQRPRTQGAEKSQSPKRLSISSLLS